jgi:hypothetical protein
MDEKLRRFHRAKKLAVVHWMERKIPRTLPASGAAMPARAPQELIRLVVIIAFFAISFILRAAKARSNKPAPAPPARPTPLDAVREAMRKASEQARTGQSAPNPTEPPQLLESLPQPPAITPESSIVPSLLLLALLVCLGLMAYRYFAG